MQIIPLYEGDIVDIGGHLGCYLHLQLTCIAESMWKCVFFVCSDSIPRTCMKKHTTIGYADSFLKALNAKETFHAHQVSTRTLCVSSKDIVSKVQNSCNSAQLGFALEDNLNFSRFLWSLTSERDDVSHWSERPEDTAEIQAIFQRETELR